MVINDTIIKKDTLMVRNPVTTLNLIYNTKSGARKDYFEISEFYFKYDGKIHHMKCDIIALDSVRLRQPKIFFKDLNFDGFEDLMIQREESGVRNLLFEIYLYNPKTKTFEFNSQLSSLFNCKGDKMKKVIISTVYNGMKVSKEYFKWQKDSLVLIDKKLYSYD